MSTAKDGLAQFLDHVWGPETSTVFLARKPGPDLWRVEEPQIWPANKQNIVDFILAVNTQQDIYFTPGLFKDGSRTKEKENGKGSKCLWVDVDGYKDGQGSPERAVELLRELNLPLPTYRIQSSQPGAEHWYWILSDYVPAEATNEINRRLAYYLNADKACWDVSHVMRPPFTNNHKPEYDKPPVTIIAFTGEEHSWEKFKDLPTVKTAMKELSKRPEVLPDMQEVFAKYPWSTGMLEQFRTDQKEFWDGDRQDYVGRGNSLVSIAYKCAEIGMDDAGIYAVLFDCDRRWRKFADRPDRESRITEIVFKVRTKYPEGIFATQVSDEPIQQVFGFKEFLRSKFEYKWLVDGLIPANSINFISSRPGIGKSRFIMQLMAELAMGRDFLGFKVTNEQKHKVLYFSLEMGGPVLKKFAEDLAAEGEAEKYDLDILDDNMKIVPLGAPVDLSVSSGVDYFESIIDEVVPTVIFIDALSSLALDELGEKVSKAVSNKLKEWLKKYECTIYIVHHNRKPEKGSENKAPTEADFFGSTFGQTDAGSIVALWKPPGKDGKVVQMVSIKSRIGVAFEPVNLDNTRFVFSKIDGDINEYTAFSNPNIGQNPNAKPENPGFGFGLE